MRFFRDFVRIASPSNPGHIYSMIIDTGAKVTVIPKKIAIAENLKKIRRASPPSPGGLIPGYVCRADVELSGTDTTFLLSVFVPDKPIPSALLGMDYMLRIGILVQVGPKIYTPMQAVQNPDDFEIVTIHG